MNYSTIKTLIKEKFLTLLISLKYCFFYSIILKNKEVYYVERDK